MLELVATLPGHKADRVWHVAWSAVGRYLASCGEDREIRIYETVVDMVKMQIDDSVFAGVNAEMKKGVDDNSGWSSEDCIRCIATLEDGQLRTIRSCEWSPNGKMIASASFDGTVVVWEAQNNAKSRWDQVSSLEGHENEVKSVAWSSDSKWLATCGRDKRVWIWERLQDNEFECVSMLDGHSQDVQSAGQHFASSLSLHQRKQHAREKGPSCTTHALLIVRIVLLISSSLRERWTTKPGNPQLHAAIKQCFCYNDMYFSTCLL
jgi:WD40 repeat protein